MNKEELIKEIKKSRKQNTNERYEYINSHFNQTNYAISLEKYIKELLKENKELENNWNELKKWLEEETKKGGSSIDLSIRIHTIQEVLNRLEGNND